MLTLGILICIFQVILYKTKLEVTFKKLKYVSHLDFVVMLNIAAKNIMNLGGSGNPENFCQFIEGEV